MKSIFAKGDNRVVYFDGFAAPVVVDSSGNMTQDGRALKVHVCKGGNGYCYTTVKLKDGGFKTFSVHKLVATAWYGRTNEEVDHIDGNPRNNKPSNLQWVSHKTNMNRSRTRARLSASMKEAWKDRTAVANGVFAWEAGVPVENANPNWFGSVKEAAKALGVAASRIYKIINGTYGYKSANGWAFAAA